MSKLANMLNRLKLMLRTRKARNLLLGYLMWGGLAAFWTVVLFDVAGFRAVLWVMAAGVGIYLLASSIIAAIKWADRGDDT